MIIKEIYKIWAKSGAKWVSWVRPVAFIGIGANKKGYSFNNLCEPVIEYVDETYENTAIIVDLPGISSVEEGIGLAYKGFRPIPLFNGTLEPDGATATVDNQAISIALEWGASKLVDIELEKDARPAFLLDSNRLNRHKMNVGIFDNSWDVYSQDMPSAEYLILNGIEKVVVVQNNRSKDLKMILREYKKKKIKIKEVKRFG